ncbi:unnamed protein product [Aureobasidium uvarum]|uniref:Uncharacterized protein n=1 Tax=Aureobasidium uvarum TaxID=2773716 RepID=A0A9N8KQK0_9PEZI|nr:unnamed protein product [Aureobasidium uvarum]
MVPLVCIFASLGKSQLSQTDNRPNIEVTGSPTENITAEDSSLHLKTRMQEWQTQVEKALQFFEKMNRWSAAAKKSRDVVSRLYEASKFLASEEYLHNSSTHSHSINTHALDFDVSSQAQQPVSTSDPTTNDIWGLSPNRAATLNNFWFDDMMWDVPVTLDTDIFENTGNGFELDWLAGLNDTHSGSDVWQFQQ